MSGTHVTDDERAQILAMHAEGVTRNQIAKRFRRSPNTIGYVVQRAGGTFERSPNLAIATAARMHDVRARRAQILDDLTSLTEELLKRTRGETHKAILKGELGVEEIRDLDTLPAREARDLIGAISMNVTAIGKLVAMDSGGEAETAKSMLSGVQEQLQAYAAEPEEPQEET